MTPGLPLGVPTRWGSTQSAEAPHSPPATSHPRPQRALLVEPQTPTGLPQILPQGHAAERHRRHLSAAAPSTSQTALGAEPSVQPPQAQFCKHCPHPAGASPRLRSRQSRWGQHPRIHAGNARLPLRASPKSPEAVYLLPHTHTQSLEGMSPRLEDSTATSFLLCHQPKHPSIYPPVHQASWGSHWVRMGLWKESSRLLWGLLPPLPSGLWASEP